MKLTMTKIICIIILSSLLIGCAGIITGKYNSKGQLTGVEATGGCEGGFKQNADGSNEAWINNKTQIIPSGLIEATGIRGA